MAAQSKQSVANTKLESLHSHSTGANKFREFDFNFRNIFVSHILFMHRSLFPAKSNTLKSIINYTRYNGRATDTTR